MGREGVCIFVRPEIECNPLDRKKYSFECHADYTPVEITKAKLLVMCIYRSCNNNNLAIFLNRLKTYYIIYITTIL